MTLPYLWEASIVAVTVAVVFLVKWILEPVFQYKYRKSVREFELWEAGAQVSLTRFAMPYLLRPEQGLPNSDETIATEEIIDLSMVVPCYNEESRLPKMMQEHIAYVVRAQKEGKMKPRVEFVLVDDGSSDRTWDIIVEMTRQYPQTE